MLTMRRRGRYYHVRGTIRVGTKARIVQERSTGCDRREDAEAYRSQLERDIRDELLYGARGKAARLTIADAGKLYLERPGGLGRGDIWRLGELNKIIGDAPIADAKQAWGRFVASRCQSLKPATVDRFRAVMQAALNHAAEMLEIDVPRLKPVRFSNERVRFLAIDEQERLLAAYTKHVRPIATALCFQGLRTGEALRADWRDIQWNKNSWFIPDTKTGYSRTIALHPRTRRELHRIWLEQGTPREGRVFLNRLGKPYSDPRTYKIPGGNPIRKAHETACKRAKIDDFRPHDWRHHWASWCVMSGIDVESLRSEGGWRTLQMVQRYARVSAKHRAQAMKKYQVLGN